MSLGYGWDSVKAWVDDLLPRGPLLGVFRTSRQGVKDVIVSMVPQVVGVVTGFVSSILIARSLGPHDLGRYALVMSLMTVAVNLSDLGIGQAAVEQF